MYPSVSDEANATPNPELSHPSGSERRGERRRGCNRESYFGRARSGSRSLGVATTRQRDSRTAGCPGGVVPRLGDMPVHGRHTSSGR